VARVLTASGAERSAVVDLIRAQARGDRTDVLSRLRRCPAACRARALAAVRATPRSNEISVVRYDGLSGVSLAGRGGVARIVWKEPRRLTIVQCVGVRRTGDPFGGYDVSVTALSPPIGRESRCPGR
jgi:hypothetical protein